MTSLFVKREKERLQTLEDYSILDTPPESCFDDITLIASRICGTPIALVSLVDMSRQWFKSRVGLEATETPRDISFCTHAIGEKKTFIVPDATLDNRFANNPLVNGDLNIRFYAGAQLFAPDGYALGTLCVIDSKPRYIEGEQIESLQALARQVVSQMELRKQLRLSDEVHTRMRLTEEDLRKAEQSARHQTKRKADFLANMSHEIRTPLNAVIGLNDLLLETKLDDHQRHLAETAQESGNLLLELVNDVLDLSKFESGSFQIDRTDFSIAQVVDQQAKLLQPKFAAKNLIFRANIDDSVPELISGDSRRFGQIVLNLLSNSLKFTHTGGVTINITREKNHIFAEVIDTGIGLTREEADRLFRPFHQSDETTARKYGGTGLGLSICKSLIEAMDGDIGVSSEKGKGSRFYFTMGFAPAQEASIQKHAAPDQVMPAALTGLRVLVVDDNAVNTMLVLVHLKAIGCLAQAVHSGGEAIALIQLAPFDVVLMDCQMPTMDGFEATEQIRKIKGLETLPIVALTASAMQGERERCIARGMDDYLTKPLKRQPLSAVLAKWAPREINSRVSKLS